MSEKREFTVEFFVRNPFYTTVKAESREEAERLVRERFEDVNAFMDAILAYFDYNEFDGSDYNFGTTLNAE